MSSQQAIARLTRRPPRGASKLLASEPLEVDAGRGFARIAFLGRPEFATETGQVHGGFLTAMLDEAMAIAAVAQRNFAFVVPTLEMKTSYLAAVAPGRLTAEGQVLRADARVAYLEGRLFDSAGALAATATATARFRKAPWA